MITNPNNLLQYMSKIKYDNLTPEDKYIVKTPTQLSKKLKGICYDQVELERKYFTKWKYPHKTYFAYESLPIEFSPTHTFLIFEEKGKYYWFENSWASYRSISNPFPSYSAAVDFVKTQLRKSSGWKSVNVIEYSKPAIEGLNINQFGNYIVGKK